MASLCGILHEEFTAHYLRRMNLITGATGLLGTHVMLELLSRGESVRALIRPDSKKEIVKQVFRFYGSEDSFGKIEWFSGDVLDVVGLSDAMEGCSTVYHCAALVSYHPRDRKEMYAVNVGGTANVVNVALKLGSVSMVHVSSIAAIGRGQHSTLLTEDSPWGEEDNPTHYAISKYLSEMEVWRAIQEGLEAVIFNCGLIIGPGEFTRSSSAMFRRVFQGIPFYPPGGTGFIAASDAASIMVQLAEGRHFGERFIGVAENLSIKDVLSRVSDTLKKRAPKREATPILLFISLLTEQVREWITGRKALVTREILRNMKFRHFYDNTKLKKALGFEFVPIQDAIEKTGQAFRAFTGT
jgi:dihydroflavonol-4-reductase